MLVEEYLEEFPELVKKEYIVIREEYLVMVEGCLVMEEYLEWKTRECLEWMRKEWR